MRTSADFITGMSKRARSSEFACYVRNYTGSALRLEIRFGSLEAAPRMSGQEQKQLIANNREKFAVAKQLADTDEIKKTHSQRGTPSVNPDSHFTKQNEQNTPAGPDNVSAEPSENW